MKLSSVLCLCFVLSLFTLCESRNLGIDVDGGTCDGSSWDSYLDFKCFKDHGKSYAIIQVWQGGFGRTAAIAHCVSEAYRVGMRAVSLYAYACPNCGGNNPAFTVFRNLILDLKAQKVNFTFFYFDIEECPPQRCWTDDKKYNAEFLGQAVLGVKSAGHDRIGIYSSQYTWASIMGSNSSFADLVLWYPHWDGTTTFSDFEPFAGWKVPHMKQYADTTDVGCYSNVDLDYFP